MHRSPSSPLPPLPGTTRRPRGLFIDRWGTLLHLVEGGHGKKASDVVFFEGVLDALFRASQRGWKTYLIGNEEAVARGRVSVADWEAIQAEVLGRIAGAGVCLQRDYTCNRHPEGQDPFRGDSVYALPNTGAFYHASHTDGVELRESWVIGDSTLELSAGSRAGCHTAGLRSGEGLADGQVHVEPDFVADDLTAALGEILALERLLRR